MTTRHELREMAFALVFEYSITKENMMEIIDSAQDSNDQSIEGYALKLSLGVEKNIEEINNVINQYSRSWSVDRLAKVTVAVLRVAIYEMIYEKDIPIAVSINEAVEIAKEYGSKEDAPYVNGILSSVAKDEQLLGEKFGK